jgi:hypothetical protein
LLVRMQNGAATLDNSLVISCKNEPPPVIWPRNPSPMSVLQRNENTHLHTQSSMC